MTEHASDRTNRRAGEGERFATDGGEDANYQQPPQGGGGGQPQHGGQQPAGGQQPPAQQPRGPNERVQAQGGARSVDRRDQQLHVDESIVLTTTDQVPGREIAEVLGVVRGNSVRAKNVGRDITQGIRNLFGGELPQYGQLLADTRDQAEYRLLAAATELDADAVVTMRIETSEIGGAAAEIHTYGTAVRLE